MSEEKETLKCPVCGREFQKYRRKAYCSPKCVQINFYKRRRESGANKPKKKKKGPNQELSEWALAAREAGMTYGQYTALMEAKKRGERVNL